MTDLQLALLAVGVAVLLLVLGLNVVQERRLKRRERGLPDIPEPGGATEPNGHGGVEHHLDDLDVPAGRRRATVPGALEASPSQPHVGAAEPAAGASTVPGADSADQPGAIDSARESPLDSGLDYVVTLEFTEQHLGEEILRRAAEVIRTERGVIWEGWSDRFNAWELIAASRRYERARVGMQLVDRRGSASEIELLGFCQDIQSFGATLVAEIQFPPRAEAIKGALEFDRSIVDLDIQVALNVVKPSGVAFQGNVIRQVATLAGALLDEDGRFRRLNISGAECYSVANLEAEPFTEEQINALTTRGVSVMMDVPRAPDDAAAFDQFVAFARDLARVLEGDLVDDNRQPIDPDALQSIASEINAVRSRLHALGVLAGSALALRLFS